MNHPAPPQLEHWQLEAMKRNASEYISRFPGQVTLSMPEEFAQLVGYALQQYSVKSAHCFGPDIVQRITYVSNGLLYAFNDAQSERVTR